MYAKITRDIQECLNRQSVPREEIVEMAHEYTEACEQVNQRAARVVTLLNQGYRIEALEYADQRPALLELMHQLDFSSLQRWEDRLAAEGLPKSTGVDRTSAELVEDAYDEVRNLENQLKQNRMLALSQAPLPARITVLKRLAQKDPVNPLWKMDIENLERARIEQIQDEFEYARKRNDLEKLEALEEELSRKWEIPISKSVKQRITKGRDKIGINAAKQRMQKTAKALNEAFMAYDTEQGFQLRIEWDEDNQIAQLDADDPLWAEVREAFAWLDEATEQQFSDDDFNAAVGQLENAIEQRLPINELEQKIYAVQKFDREIPPSLVQRVTLYRRQIATGQKRSFVTIAISAVLAILLIGAGVYWLIGLQQSRATLNETVQHLKNLAGDYPSAEAYVDQLPEELQTNPQVSAVWSGIQHEHTTQTQKDQNFRAVLDQFDIDGELGHQMATMLDEAEALADDETEQAEVERLRRTLDGERSRRSNQRNMEFASAVEKFSQQLNRNAGDGERTNLVKLRDELKMLIANRQGQTDGRATISTSNAQLASDILARIVRQMATMTKNDQAIQSLANLPSPESDLARFLDALSDFSDTHGEHSFAADFKAVSGEQKLWEEIKNWQSMVANHQWDRLYEMENSDAAELLESLQELQANSHEIWLEKNLDELQEVLTQLADPNQKTTKQLSDTVREYLDNEARLRYQQVAIIDGKYHYLSQNPAASAQGQRRIYFYLDTEDLEDIKNERFRDDEIEHVGEAGHCRVTKELLAVEHEDYDNIHDYGLDLVRIALSSQTQGVNAADPFGRALILDFLLEEVANASAPCQPVFTELREELKPIKLFQTNWFRPGQGIANQRREQLKDKIFPSAFKEINDLKRTLNSKSSEDSNLFDWQDQLDIKIIGWTRQDESGQWILKSNTKFEKELEAWIVLPVGTGTTKGELKKIGTVSKTGVLNVELPDELKNGRPVLTITK